MHLRCSAALCLNFNLNFTPASSGGQGQVDLEIKSEDGTVLASQSSVYTATEGDNPISLSGITIPNSDIIGSEATAESKSLTIEIHVHDDDATYTSTVGTVSFDLFVGNGAPTVSKVYDAALELYKKARINLKAGFCSNDEHLALAKAIASNIVYSPYATTVPKTVRGRLNTSPLECESHAVLMNDIYGTLGFPVGNLQWVWGGRMNPSERNFVYTWSWLAFKNDDKATISYNSTGSSSGVEFTYHVIVAKSGKYYDPSYGEKADNLATVKGWGKALWNYYSPLDPDVVVRVETEADYNSSDWKERSR